MDISEARAIIKTLAKGVDPFTGEVFAEDSPYNHPQVIRALFAAHDATFAGVGVEAGDGDARRLDAEIAAQARVGQADRVGQEARVECSGHVGERYVDRCRHHAQVVLISSMLSASSSRRREPSKRRERKSERRP